MALVLAVKMQPERVRMTGEVLTTDDLQILNPTYLENGSHTMGDEFGSRNNDPRPVHPNGDVHCPVDNEWVNVRCWKCGWRRTGVGPDTPTETRVGGGPSYREDGSVAYDPSAAPDVPGEPVPALPEPNESLRQIVETCDMLLFGLDQGALNTGDDWLRSDFNSIKAIAAAALAARPALPGDTEALRKVILASLKRTVANDDAEYGVPLRLLLVMAKDASAALAAVPLGPEPTTEWPPKVHKFTYPAIDGPEPTIEGGKT